MKILLTVHQFLPAYFAGTEVIAYGIADELQRRGHAVTLLTGHPDAAPRPDADRFDRYRHAGLDIERFWHSAHPMGSQGVVTELAYDNRLFAAAFDDLLARLAPDVVHFVHLARLSASVIGPCVDRGIPTVFTPTDFWATCPRSQLRLPDNTTCAGPDPSGLNCVRHFAMEAGRGRPALARLARHAPDWLLATGIRAARLPLPLMPALAAEIGALSRRRVFVRDQLNRVDRVLAPSRVMERALLAGGIAAGRMQRVPYGIDVARFRRDTARGLGPGLRLGFLGSLLEHKGVHVLVEAMGLVDRTLPVTLDVYGPTRSGAACERYVAAALAATEADPRIRFHGPVPREQVPDVLARIDALVVPSIWIENTPLVVDEAFAAGCPVIASDVDGIAEVVRHDVNGLLFATGDPRALAAALTRVATNRALIPRLAARTPVPTSVPEHVDELEAIYEAVLAERAARGPAPPVDAPWDVPAVV